MLEDISAPSAYLDLALRLVLATAIGAAIGINREIHHKPAGMRTHALVGLGAALLAIVGVMLADPEQPGDGLSRIVQGIVAGIGFLGGGVILRRGGKQEVQGLTTAASIWLVSAVGVATGAGLWRTALTAAALALLVLAGRPVDKAIRQAADDKVEG